MSIPQTTNELSRRRRELRQGNMIAHAARVECLRLVAHLARNAIPIAASVVVVVAYWLWQLVDHTAVLAWAGLMLGAMAASLALFSLFRRSAGTPARMSVQTWERIVALKSFLNGVAWGLLAFFVMPHGSEPQKLFLILMLGTVALGATGILSPSRIAFYCFVIPLLAPLAIDLIVEQSPIFALAGWSVLAYLALLILLHDLFHRSLMTTLMKRLESDALAQEQQVIFDTAAEAICFIKPHVLVKCNKRFADLLGYTIEELVGRPSWTWHADFADWRKLATASEPIIRAGGSYTTRAQFRRKDGSVFWAELTGHAVDPGNLALGMVWMGEDISERLRTEAALKASEDRFRRLVSLSSDWYWEQDAELRFTRVQGSRFETGNIDLSGTLGKRRWEVEGMEGISAEQWRVHRQLLEQRKPFRDFTYQMKNPNGELRWCSTSGNPMFDERGNFCGYHGVGTDITERVRGAERYRHLAYHDMLTGLPNRRLFSDRMEQSIARARRKGHRVAVMVLDLDDFKIINDTHGHSAGDEVLIAVSQRLRKAVRESDTVARLGGDEFVVLLPETLHPQDAGTVAEKIIETIREPVEIGSRQYFLGVSVGLAIFPDHASTAEKLLQQADIAMYIAKRRGGSSLQFATRAESSSSAPTEASASDSQSRKLNQ